MEEMKGDRKLCTAAVGKGGMALEFASQEMNKMRVQEKKELHIGFTIGF